MHKVLCFGELLLRFSPQLNGQWISQSNMPVYIGGAELNVAKALALWQVPVSYCTALPENYLTKEIVNEVHSKNISTEKIIYSGNRIGTYYLPADADLKHASVIYDRAHSSFAELEPNTIEWNKILEGITWFHFSAISPAVSQNAVIICKEVLQAAKTNNITISIDLNYRSKLWQYGKEPIQIMPELVSYCDIIMGNIWAKEKMLGISISQNMKPDNNGFLNQSEKSSQEILSTFPNCKQVANTFRFDVDKGVKYFASLFSKDTFVHSQEQKTDYIIDKVGSGDAFMAGLIYGNTNSLPPQNTIDFAAAAAFNKLFIKGDSTTSTVQDIRKQLING